MTDNQLINKAKEALAAFVAQGGEFVGDPYLAGTNSVRMQGDDFIVHFAGTRGGDVTLSDANLEAIGKNMLSRDMNEIGKGDFEIVISASVGKRTLS